jgi:hypothetical protein
MIRLFRKIRQQLLSNEKYPIYILYASGEILLVVIGILLALQIDNWNDQRKERMKEHSYLRAIKNDVELNRKELESFIRQKQTAIHSANIILTYFENDTISDPAYFNLHNLNVSITNNFEEKNNTFKELENSGQLELISNQEIKNLLLDMDLVYRRIDFHSEHLYNDLRDLNYALQFHVVDLDPTVKNYTYQLTGGTQGEDVKPSIEPYRILLKDLGYKNSFILSNYNNQLIIGGLEEILQKSDQLVELIHAELE